MSSLTNWLSVAAFLVAAPLAAQDLPDADVVIVGEVHDNPEHHIQQAAIVTDLAPQAVVFEMLSPDQAARVTPDLLADKGALEDALNWAQSGWPDFAIYYPIFAALGDAQVYGAAVPVADVRAAMTEGAAARFGADADRFGLTAPLPEEQLAARKSLQDDAHCNAMPAEMLGGMVEAQRLRDAAFARTTLQALEQVGGPVVVITGVGHARKDWGIPAKIATASPSVSVVSIGYVEAPPSNPEVFDLIYLTDPTPREDPCAAFR